MDNENIKEILDRINNYPEKLYCLNEKEKHLLLDYITNLQEKCKSLDEEYKNLQEELDISQANEETYRLEMLDITKILGLDEHTTFDEVKEYATNLQEENEELREDNFAYHQLMKMQNKREYRSKFLKDFQKEYGENVFPDYDAIYKRYDDYKTRNKKAVEYIEKGNKHFKENYNEPYEYAFMVNADEIMKILKGKSDE